MGSRRQQNVGCRALSFVLAMQFGIVSGNNWRHGYISWATCDGGFYDPAYPNVCRSCTSPLCVGVTISIAIRPDCVFGDGSKCNDKDNQCDKSPCSLVDGDWIVDAKNLPGAVDPPPSTWMKYVAQDVNAFKQDSTKRTLRMWRQRSVQLSSGLQKVQPNKQELRIGYMEGLGDKARPPSISNPFNGVFECSVRPCAESGESWQKDYLQMWEDNYLFYIDRLDLLENIVYAHFSFQTAFDKNGDYSVYMDGCCRPVIQKNKFTLPFHLRAGIQIYAAGQPGGEARPYAKQSIVVNMPETVVLRQGGVSYDDCKNLPCNERMGDDVVCYLFFQVQTYHPIKEYRSKIRARLAHAGESGWWRCGKQVPGLAGSEPSTPEWKVFCDDNQNGLAFYEPEGTVIQPTIDTDGYPYFYVRFMVSRTGPQSATVLGMFSLNLMVDCEGCVNGDTQSVPVEMVVNVKVAESNADPPALTTKSNPLVDVSGVLKALPATCQQSPLQIRCGRKRFELGGLYSEKFLRVAFKDVDDGTNSQCDPTEMGYIRKDIPQNLKIIQSVTNLPGNALMSSLVFGSDLNSAGAAILGGKSYLRPDGAGYVDIDWRPACENPAHLGLKQFCFRARDSFKDLNTGVEVQTFPSLWSIPSMLDVRGLLDSSNPMCPLPRGSRPSCIFINVSAPMPNIAPEFVQPQSPYYFYRPKCSGGCCECCGQEGCACEDSAYQITTGRQCCTVLYTTIGRVFKLPVRVVDGPILASDAYRVGQESFFPVREDDDSFSISLNFNFPSNIQPAPIIRTPKQFCGSATYDKCVEKDLGEIAERTTDLMTEVEWDLTGIGFSCKRPGATSKIKCSGPEDKSTCGSVQSGATECKKDEVPRPFMLCYRAVEQIAPTVNHELWKRFYGVYPGQQGCDICVKLAVADRPVFLEDDNVSPLQGQVFTIAAGRELNITFTAAAANDNGEVRVSVLSDPGAPLGTSLSQAKKVFCTEVTATCNLFHQSGWQRIFSYTPLAEHGGQRFEVCFRASMRDLKEGIDIETQISEPRCITIRVMKAVVDWEGTKPCTGACGTTNVPQARITSTVGCKISYDFQARAELYELSHNIQKLPTCSNCVDGGLAVKTCSETRNSWPCCGNGHCDGAEMGSNCPADCPADDISLRILQTGSFTNDYVSRSEFRWTLTRGMEGRQLLSCFNVFDAVLGTSIVATERTVATATQKPTSPSFCLVVDVERCRYCVPDGSSMQSIAKHYLLNVDWLRLYNTNPVTSDPDGFFPYDKLAIGPTYTVSLGDTLLTIAGSAKTTVKSILENNPDILDDSQLKEGQKICLLLCSSPRVE